MAKRVRATPVVGTTELFKVGMDVGAKFPDISRLLWGYRPKLMAMGVDYNDFLQEVALGILVRNNGKGAMDPYKSSLGTYVHMVANCVFCNLASKLARTTMREVLDPSPLVDPPPRGGEGPSGVSEGVVIADFQKFLEELGDSTQPAEIARVIVALVYQGLSRSEIADRVGLPAAKVGRALGYLRDVAPEWVARGERGK